MGKVKSISKEEFFNKYKVKEIDLVKVGLFSQKDLKELSKYQDRPSILQKISLLPSYFFFTFKNPQFIYSFILPKLNFLGKNAEKKSSLKLKDKNPIKNCILKTSIVASFQPKVILEIGTYLGWAAASFKKACPNAQVYTLDVKKNNTANNPIDEQKIGYFYKKKRLKIKQIWSDSTVFNYNSIPKPDIVYIDGNHSYKYAYSDLQNSSKIAKRCIILDDYVPKNSNQLYCPWNESVVRATNDFLKNNNRYKDAYWIKNTPLCILMQPYE